MLLEDVACSTEKLGQMSKDLIGIFKKYGYHDACLMGHALEGNPRLTSGFVSASSFQLPASSFQLLTASSYYELRHALEGNLHLIFNQSFKSEEELKRME